MGLHNCPCGCTCATLGGNIYYLLIEEVRSDVEDARHKPLVSRGRQFCDAVLDLKSPSRYTLI